MEARQYIGKRGGKTVNQVQDLSGEISAHGKPPALSELCGEQGYEYIRDIGDDELLYIYLFHNSSPLSLCFTFAGCSTCSRGLMVLSF